jgi:hypothetical protein
LTHPAAKSSYPPEAPVLLKETKVVLDELQIAVVFQDGPRPRLFKKSTVGPVNSYFVNSRNERSSSAKNLVEQTCLSLRLPRLNPFSIKRHFPCRICVYMI